MSETLWVVPALAFTCMTLLWGLGWSWIGLIIASIALPLRRWRRGYTSRRTCFDISVMLFLLASLVGLAVSPDRSLSLRAFQSVVACILLYYSLANVANTGYVKCGFAFAVVGVLVAGVLTFRSGFKPPSAFGGFGNWLVGVLGHLPQAPRLSNISNPILSTAHGLAIALEMVLLPLVGLALFMPKASGKAVVVLASLPVLALLLLLGSQGAWLAVAVGVVILLLWRSWWSVLPVIAALGLAFLNYWQGWIDPQTVFSQFGPLHSLGAREGLWAWGMEVIRHHPVAGCGLGCLGEFSPTPFLSPHNAYLQFYADMGLVGSLALLAALVVGARMSLDLAKAPRNDSRYGFVVGIVAAGVAVAVHGLFEGSPAGIIAEAADGYFYIVSPVLAILAGLFVATRRLMQDSDPRTPTATLQSPN